MDARTEAARSAGDAPLFGSDRARVQALLNAFADEIVTGRRRDLLRLAIDLFDVNDHLAGDAVTADSERAALVDLIEIVEISDPRGRLFVTRGLELKTQLERYLRRGAWATAQVEHADPRLLARREALRERADTMLRRFGKLYAIAA